MEPEIVTDMWTATLDGALAALRTVAAEALSPGALLAAERASSARARAMVAALAQPRSLDLPAGFADLVEVDVALDELLAGWAPTQPAPVIVAPAPRAAPPPPGPRPAIVVPAAPEPVRAAAPAPAVAWIDDGSDDDDFPYAEAAVEVARPPARTITPEPEPEPERLPEVAAPLPSAFTEPPPAATKATELVSSDDDDDERTAVVAPGARPGAVIVSSADAWVVYEDQPPRDVYLDEDDEFYDPSAVDDGGGYVTYAEPDPVPYDDVAAVDEPLPEYAAPEPEPEPAPVVVKPPARGAAAVRVESPGDEGDEWAFQADGPAATASDASPYAAVRHETTRFDEGDDRGLPDLADEVQTTVMPRPRAAGPRPAAAAIQLGAGGARVLGEGPIDEGEGELIELGDTRDYGDEEAIDDEETGILGVGVVEYDEEVDEVDEVDEIEAPSALERLPGAPSLSPAEIQALVARAAEMGRRNLADGAALYGDVLDAQPDRVDAMLARGKLLLDLGDFPGAVSDFLKAEALQPRDADVQVALGDLFFSRKDYGKAVAHYNRALSAEPDHAHALSRRGMSYYHRKQFTAAVEDLERAKQLDRSLANVDSYIQRAKKRV